MDIKLKTLLMVNETKNYTIAARKLNLTQPAVSQHIKALEKEFGITIFVRQGNDLVLTNDGNTLVKYARKIDSLYENLLIKLEDSKKKTKTLRIGITHTGESTAIMDVLALYSTTHKGTLITITSDTIKNLYDKLSSFELDLVFVEGNKNDKKYASISLDSETIMVAMSAHHPLAKQNSITIKQLQKENLILRTIGSTTRKLFTHELEKIDYSLDDFTISMEIDNIATIKDLVKKNIGVSILPKSVCYEEVENHSIKLLPIENISLVREVNLLYQKDFLEQEVIDDILNLYKETVTI